MNLQVVNAVVIERIKPLMTRDNDGTPNRASFRARTKAYHNNKPRIYVWLVGSNILEDLSERPELDSDNPYYGLMADIVAHTGIQGEIKSTWNKKAGCQCGCCPGFVIKSTEIPLGHVDIHVQVIIK